MTESARPRSVADSRSALAVRKGSFRPAFPYAVAHAPTTGRILDLGCAEGDELELFPGQAVGVDLACEFLMRCRGKAAHLVRADINHPLPFQDRSFAGVLLSHVLEHVDAPVRLLRECHRVLSAGGVLLVGIPNETWLVELRHPYFKNHPYHLYSFSRSNIEHLLTVSGFGTERMYFDLPTLLGWSRRFLLPLAQWLPRRLVMPFAQSYWVIGRKAYESLDEIRRRFDNTALVRDWQRGASIEAPR